MKKTAIRSLSESQLALYQTLQQGNDCSLHAISAALSILGLISLDPDLLIKEINKLWRKGRLYRIAPNSGVTPAMQSKIIKYIAQKNNLPISADLVHLTPELLKIIPENEDLLALVTIYWHWGNPPGIYYGNRSKNYNRLRRLSGHTMLFASYDPDHTNAEIGRTPWGFINSWVKTGRDLFWMTDEDFRRSWSFNLPRIGNNAAVIIHKKRGN